MLGAIVGNGWIEGVEQWRLIILSRHPEILGGLLSLTLSHYCTLNPKFEEWHTAELYHGKLETANPRTSQGTGTPKKPSAYLQRFS